jgi:hypothetical protein
MQILIDLIAAYAIYMLGTALLVLRQAKRDRVPGLIIVWIAPFLTIISSAIATARLIIERPLLASPCPEGLESAEQAVAEKRQQMFGGSCPQPQVAARWAKYYSFALEYEASRVQKFANKLRHFHSGLRVAS